jgi:hypothetical protein
MRQEVSKHRRVLTRLDATDPHLTQKATAAAAAMRAILDLNRRFYRAVGLEEVAGESSIDGG